MDTDSYEDIYAEMRKRCSVGQPGTQGLYHPRGRSTALGSIGYAECVRNWRSRPRRPESRSAMWPPPLAPAAPPLVWCWSTSCFSRRPRQQVWVWIPTPLRRSYPGGERSRRAGGPASPPDSRFRMIYHVGAGYAIPNAETPLHRELARQEGILLDPVYTGKAWAKF